MGCANKLPLWSIHTSYRPIVEAGRSDWCIGWYCRTGSAACVPAPLGQSVTGVGDLDGVEEGEW